MQTKISSILRLPTADHVDSLSYRRGETLSAGTTHKKSKYFISKDLCANVECNVDKSLSPTKSGDFCSLNDDDTRSKSDLPSPRPYFHRPGLGSVNARATSKPVHASMQRPDENSANCHSQQPLYAAKRKAYNRKIGLTLLTEQLASIVSSETSRKHVDDFDALLNAITRI